LADPADELILEAAVNGQAEAIVKLDGVSLNQFIAGASCTEGRADGGRRTVAASRGGRMRPLPSLDLAARPPRPGAAPKRCPCSARTRR
jgi:hypothetical protein